MRSNTVATACPASSSQARNQPLTLRNRLDKFTSKRPIKCVVMRSGRKAVAVIFIAALLVGALPGVVSAHLQAANSVDTSLSPPEIQYTKQGNWQSFQQWGLDRFDALSPVNIRAYTACCNDLALSSDTTDNGLCGRYWPYLPGADIIELYDPAYQAFNTSQRRACAVHEVGHALSLGHHSGGSSVMDPSPASYNPSIFTTLQSHDISAYHQKWGN